MCAMIVVSPTSSVKDCALPITLVILTFYLAYLKRMRHYCLRGIIREGQVDDSNDLIMFFNSETVYYCC